jgi:hypothetical protein
MSLVLPHWLLHLDEWRILVCTQCECGIAPAELSQHLRRAPHHGLSEHQQRDIVAYAQSLLLPAPAEVRQPGDGGPPLPGLRVNSGWACTWRNCHQPHRVCKRQPTAQQHQCRFHNDDDTHFGACYYQTLVPGQTARFVMRVPGSDSSNVNSFDDSDAHRQVSSVAWQLCLAAEQQAQRRSMYDGAQRRAAEDAPMWLCVMGVYEHLRNVHTPHMHKLYTPAAHFADEMDERVLALARAVTRLLTRLSRWASAPHMQRTRPQDLQLLHSNERAFCRPASGIDEWVRCCIYSTQLVLLRTAHQPQQGIPIFYTSAL